MAQRVGAEGSDAYSLLAAIGRDCVGALQFIAGDDDLVDVTLGMEGEPIDEGGIEKLLRSLAHAPLGLSRDDDFRISVAGAQEKTALLWDGKRWLKPIGTTPTTHILKPQIGELPNGIDLSNSVENEFYCLKLLKAFGFLVNRVTIGRSERPRLWSSNASTGAGRAMAGYSACRRKIAAKRFPCRPAGNTRAMADPVWLRFSTCSRAAIRPKRTG